MFAGVFALATEGGDEGHEAAEGGGGMVGVLLHTLSASSAVVGIAGGDEEGKVQCCNDSRGELYAAGEQGLDMWGEGTDTVPIETEGGTDEHEGEEMSRQADIVDGDVAVEKDVVEHGGILREGLVRSGMLDTALEDVQEGLFCVLHEKRTDDVIGLALNLYVLQLYVGELELLHAVEHGDT